MNRIVRSIAFSALFVWACVGSPGAPPGPPVDLSDDQTDDHRKAACLDDDGDGFGTGCEAGPDCDDAEATIHEGCVACGSNPREGCTCEASTPIDCHSPAPLPDERGRMRCFSGHRSCSDGVWGACEYDEAWTVVSPVRALGGAPASCGNCDPGCWESGGTVEETDLTEDNGSGVIYDCLPDGEDGEDCGIVIDGRPTEGGEHSYIAMPGDGSGTVAKIRNSDGQEVARYYAGLSTNAANSPSRTTIDALGNAYVGNRAFGEQGTATKLAGSSSSCVDRNANGQIDTSTDSTPLPIGTDECILWSTSLGREPGSVPRGLAVDRGDPVEAPGGYIWVGTWFDKDNLENTAGGRAYQLRPSDGTIRQSIQLPQHVYGAVADNRNPQRIWFVNKNNGLLTAVNVSTGAVEGPFWPNEPGRCTERRGVTTCELGKYGGYGLAFDGRHVWTAAKGSSFAHGYDVVDNVWCRVATTGPCDKGVGVRLEDNGQRTVYCGGDSGDESAVNFWDSDFAACAAVDTNGAWCTGWDGDDCEAEVTEVRAVRTFGGAVGMRLMGAEYSGGLGVGVDFQNRVWLVNKGSGNVAVYDPDADTVIEYPTTGPGLGAPYTYSDFTGYQRAVFTNFSGTFSHDYGVLAPACPPNQSVVWGDLTWTAVMPPATHIRFTVRTARTEAGLPDATAVILGEAPTNPAPLYVDDALVTAGVARHEPYLRVTATLISDDGSASPILQGLNLDWVCTDNL